MVRNGMAWRVVAVSSQLCHSHNKQLAHRDNSIQVTRCFILGIKGNYYIVSLSVDGCCVQSSSCIRRVMFHPLKKDRRHD